MGLRPLHPCCDRPAPIRGTQRAAEIEAWGPTTEIFFAHELGQNPPPKPVSEREKVGELDGHFFPLPFFVGRAPPAGVTAEG